MRTQNDLINQMNNDGLVVSSSSLVIGKLTRCPTIDKPNKKKGWYRVFNNDDFIFAFYQIFGIHDDKIRWHSSEKKTPGQNAFIAKCIEESQKELDIEKTKALKECIENYDNYVKPLNTSFQYLADAKLGDFVNIPVILPLGYAGSIYNQELKEYVLTNPLEDASKNVMIVPFYNMAGLLTGFQKIDQNGNKFMQYGSQKSDDKTKLGNFYPIAYAGTSMADAPAIAIGEGAKTMIAFFVSTGIYSLAAIDSGNIEKVCNAVWSKYKDMAIILVVDNDASNEKNVGLDKCTALVEKFSPTKNIKMYIPREI